MKKKSNASFLSVFSYKISAPLTHSENILSNNVTQKELPLNPALQKI